MEWNIIERKWHEMALRLQATTPQRRMEPKLREAAMPQADGASGDSAATAPDLTRPVARAMV